MYSGDLLGLKESPSSALPSWEITREGQAAGATVRAVEKEGESRWEIEGSRHTGKMLRNVGGPFKPDENHQLRTNYNWMTPLEIPSCQNGKCGGKFWMNRVTPRHLTNHIDIDSTFLHSLILLKVLYGCLYNEYNFWRDWQFWVSKQKHWAERSACVTSLIKLITPARSPKESHCVTDFKTLDNQKSLHLAEMIGKNEGFGIFNGQDKGLHHSCSVPFWRKLPIMLEIPARLPKTSWPLISHECKS